MALPSARTAEQAADPQLEMTLVGSWRRRCSAPRCNAVGPLVGGSRPL